MSLTALNLATTAMNALTATVAGFFATVDADVAEKRDEYEGLTGDLKATIKDEMNWVVTFDPDTDAALDGNGGTYTSLVSLMNDLPRGADCTVYLPAAQVLNVTTDNINVRNMITFATADGSAAAELVFTVQLNGAGNNDVTGFQMWHGGGLAFENTILTVGAKADAATEWASNSGCLFQNRFGYAGSVAMRDTYVNAQDGLPVINCHQSHMTVTLKDVTLDGDASMLGNAGTGTATIMRASFTPLNGAVLNDAGVVGTNLLIL